MKNEIKKLIDIIIYLFSPEDSTSPVRIGTLTFGIEPDGIGIGSAKALFWLFSLILLMIGLSYL